MLSNCPVYSEALQELGVVEMADLELLDETDLRGVGVPLIDARRLLRAVKHSAGGAVGGVPAAEEVLVQAVYLMKVT